MFNNDFLFGNFANKKVKTDMILFVCSCFKNNAGRMAEWLTGCLDGCMV